MTTLTRSFLTILMTIFSLLTYPCQSQEEHSFKPDELKSILQSGRFTGVIDGTEKIQNLGYIRNEIANYHIYYYTIEFANHRLAQRLIFISKDKKYIGMFSVNDKPLSVHGDQVTFKYDQIAGNVIQLTHEGVPQKVLLDGEIVELFQ